MKYLRKFNEEISMEAVTTLLGLSFTLTGIYSLYSYHQLYKLRRSIIEEESNRILKRDKNIKSITDKISKNGEFKSLMSEYTNKLVNMSHNEMQEFRNVVKNKLSFILTEDEYSYINNYIDFLVMKAKDDNRPKPKKNIITKNLKDGRELLIHTHLDTGYTDGDEVTIDGEYPEDGTYKIGWWDSLTIKDGKLKL